MKNPEEIIDYLEKNPEEMLKEIKEEINRGINEETMENIS